jgi:hypothetical protein
MNKGDIEVELERLRANSTLISPFYSLVYRYPHNFPL